MGVLSRAQGRRQGCLAVGVSLDREDGMKLLHVAPKGAALLLGIVAPLGRLLPCERQELLAVFAGRVALLFPMATDILAASD